MKVKDLEDRREYQDKGILLCLCCGGEYSADPADYSFLYRPEHILTCCEEPLQRVIKHTSYQALG